VKIGIVGSVYTECAGYKGKDMYMYIFKWTSINDVNTVYIFNISKIIS
jgi:hypothetical protein